MGMGIDDIVYKFTFWASRLKKRYRRQITHIKDYNISPPVESLYRTFNFELIVLVYLILVAGLPAYVVYNGYLFVGVGIALVGHLLGRTMLEERQQHKKEEWKREVVKEIENQQRRRF